MTKRIARALLFITGCAALLVPFTTASAGEDRNRFPRDLPVEARAVAEVTQWQTFAYGQAVELARIEQAVFDLQQSVGAYVNDVIAQEEAWRLEQARQQQAREDAAAAAAAQASRARPAQPQSSPTMTSGGGGSCYGGVVPDYIVTRESGGNPNAVNPSSGAWGCYQFMPSTWSSSCSDLSRDVAGQKECASRISNGGRNLQPWAL